MKMMKWLSIVTIAFFTQSVFAETPADRLTGLLSELKTMRAQFTQRVTDSKGKVIQQSNGQMALERPGRFRWDTQSTGQQIVADGKKIWIYDPDLQQVTVKAQDALNQDNPLSALTKPGLVDRFYTVSELATKQGIRYLQLVPKNTQSSPFEKAWLGFGSNGLVSMRLFDALGQVSDFTFGNWKKNSNISAKRFQFNVPKGVDVVE